jgi:hypothetical protein
MTLAVNIAQGGANNVSFRNRIINGAMVIDQRNAGASVTPATKQYTLDRWSVDMSQASKFSVQQNAGAITPPTGLSNYLGVTSVAATSLGATDYFNLFQYIEGFNFADLSWGTASAQTITLSFWVRSSLTGTFGGSLINGANTRSYPFSYTISSANTWTQASVTIAGDTSGTWVGATSGIGLKVWISLGSGSTYSGTAGAWGSTLYLSATGATSVVGTSGATFYITGVQLEAGTTASPFEYRQYGTELALCQRYYYRITAPANNSIVGAAYAQTATSGRITGSFPVTMRISPTALEQNSVAGDYAISTGGTDRICSAVPTFSALTNQYSYFVVTTVASGQTAGQAGVGYILIAPAYLGWSAEL